MLLWVGLFPGHTLPPDMLPTPSTPQADLSPIFIICWLSEPSLWMPRKVFPMCL